MTDEDLLVGCALQAFFGHQQLLVELLAGTQACVFYLYVFSRYAAGEEDQVPCKFIYPDRLSHIQDKYLAAGGVGTCLEYQGYGFRYGHEKSRYFGMCHSHRSACSYLAFEQRDYTAVAAQHVTEAYCHEACLLCSAIHLLYYHLTETF